MNDRLYFYRDILKPVLDAAEVEPVLIQLTSPDGWERRQATAYLAGLRDEQLLPLLADLTGDPEPEVNVQAVRGLAWLSQSEEARRKLAGLLNHPSEHLRFLAGETLPELIAARTLGEDMWPWLPDQAVTPAQQERWMQGGPRLREFVLELLQSSDLAVRRGVARWIYVFLDPAAVGNLAALLSLYQTETDLEIKDKLLEALAALTSPFLETLTDSDARYAAALNWTDFTLPVELVTFLNLLHRCQQGHKFCEVHIMPLERGQARLYAGFAPFLPGSPDYEQYEAARLSIFPCASSGFWVGNRPATATSRPTLFCPRCRLLEKEWQAII